MPIRRPPGGTSFTSTPSYRTCPESGSIKPAIIFRSVVLPHPLGPRMTTVSPSGIITFRFWMENAALPPDAPSMARMAPRRGSPEPARSPSLSVLHTLTRSTRAMTLLRSRSRRLVVHRPAGAARRHDQLAGDRPGLVRGQERGDVGDLGGVHHAADGVAAGGIGGEVTGLDVRGSHAQLRRAGRHQSWSPLGARDARVNAVDGDSEAAHLDGQGLGEMHEGGVARPPAQVPGVAGVGPADIDDAAPLLLLHEGDGGARAPERS